MPAGGQPADVREPDVGQTERRQPARDRTDGGHIEPESLDGGDSAGDGHERTGDAGSDPAQADDHRQRERAHEQRQSLRVAQVA